MSISKETLADIATALSILKSNESDLRKRAAAHMLEGAAVQVLAELAAAQGKKTEVAP